MQVISTRVHGMLDYLTGTLLIAAPWLFGFANGGVAQWLPMLLGAATIGMSLLTRYELSVAKLIPLRIHLAIDMANGILLAVSPWLFGFASLIWWPHLLVGLTEIVVPLLTRRDVPSEDAPGERAARQARGGGAPPRQDGIAGTTAEGVHMRGTTRSAPSAQKDAIGAEATEGAPGTTDTGAHRIPIVPPREDAGPDETPPGSSADRRG